MMTEEPEGLQYPAEETTQDIDKQALRSGKAIPAHKPGWLARLGSRVGNQLSRIELPEWNLRNFLYGLALLIAVILVARNWVDTRLDIIIWRFDVPKSVVIIVAVLLGAGLVRAWDAYRRRRGDKVEESEDE